jgi:3-methyladenine DNA glycosylase/8-oxoguanine DNA glycosylase
MLTPTSPFDFDGTVFRPDHFPSTDIHWEPGVLWQTLRWGHKNFGLRLQDLGSNTRPKIRATIFAEQKPSGPTTQSILKEVYWRFDLRSAGVPRFVKRFRNDRIIGPAIRRHPGMRLKSGSSLYEYLVITVMLQNTTVRRSVSMLQALFERYGQQVLFDDHRLWTFWDPEKIHTASEPELRALRLGYRAKTLKRQAEQFLTGAFKETELRKIREKAALVESLDEIYGVGSQSAWYMASEFFHFYDALDYVSPWEAKIVGRILFRQNVGTAKVQELLTERYKEYRLLAFAYLLIDLFWQHRETRIQWLTRLIRL